jgi:hypothetical protein
MGRNRILAFLLFVTATARAETSLFLLVDNQCLQRKSWLETRYQAVPVTVPESDMRQIFIEKVKAHPCVLRVEENVPVRSADFERDPLASQQTFLSAVGARGGEDYFFHPLWGLRWPVVAAVIDSGIQADHPDLKSRLWHGLNGEIGTDIFNGDSDPTDDFGHGTHVAGLLAAQRDNGVGVRGVMGDSVQIMAVKTQGDDGGGSVADVINGILWAADHGAEVMNLSLTTTVGNSSLEDAIAYALGKNIVVAAAAGNEGMAITPTNLTVPAGYAPVHRGLISVGAIDALSLQRTTFSNYSPNYVELAAPGDSGGAGLLSTFPGSSYRKVAGTSMSSPQVTGAAALAIGFLKTHARPYTASQIEEWIEISAATSSALTPYFASGRRLDLERLGRLMFNMEVIDSSGGFDEP